MVGLLLELARRLDSIHTATSNPPPVIQSQKYLADIGPLWRPLSNKVLWPASLNIFMDADDDVK